MLKSTSPVTQAQFNSLPLKQVREMIGDYLINGQDGSALWTLMTVTRGPDTPSEKPFMDSAAYRAAYAGRRARKADTGEVLRSRLFGGKIGGSARVRRDRDYVVLPPADERDHYDRHVEAAAGLLGLEVRTAVREKGVKVNATDGLDPLNLTQDQWLDLYKTINSSKMTYPMWKGYSFYVDKYTKHPVPFSQYCKVSIKIGEAWKIVPPPGTKANKDEPDND